ncbi:S-layer homology domain-containing protein [Paenibacillus sp. TRM 82003]|nr:S-layer homology domain-containing protein [Paenibacillus sp. TRM 82003]
MRIGFKTFLGGVVIAVAAMGGPISASAATLDYGDVKREAGWALPSVVELVQRGIFTGYEDGSFRPNQPVTRIEAIVAAIRHMGLNSEAETLTAMASELKLDVVEELDEKYRWAVGYVALAEREGLLADNGDEFEPGAPADRLWTTTLLVRAMGLEYDAKRSMKAELDLEDAELFPEGSAGYAAVALTNGLVTGYEDGTFRPKRSVTRAELAALLDRAGDRMPAASSEYIQLEAQVSSVSGDQVGLAQEGGGSNQFPVRKDATVIREGSLGGVDLLMPGDRVTAVINNFVLVHLLVTKSAKLSDGMKEGTISAIADGLLMLDEGGVKTSYRLSEEAVVERNGEAVSWSSLAIGDRAEATVRNGIVTRVAVVNETLQYGNVIGTVTAVNDREVSIQSANGVTTHPVGDNAQVTVNQRVGQWSNIEVGDSILVVISEGRVFHVTLTKTGKTTEDSVGYVAGVYKSQILIASGGITEVYRIADDADVVRKGENVPPTDLVPGDEVRMILEDYKIVYLFVTDPVEQEAFYTLEGTYQWHNYVDDDKDDKRDGSITEITVLVDVQGNAISRTFPVRKGTVVSRKGGTVIEDTELMFNQKLKLQITDQEVVYIEVS